MTGFQIHPLLLADCHVVGQFELCYLLLHKNAALPWFVLVPQADAGDLLDLPPALRATAMNEAALVSGFIKKNLDCPKINFAAIGNLVPQLHLHVVGRTAGDPCWPAPVWGHLSHGPEYSRQRVAEIAAQLGEQCGLIVSS